MPSVSLPRIYVETTIPSYLTARRSRDLRIAADQETTEEWWETQRRKYELFVSETVLDEAGAGDAEFAAKRLAALNEMPRLALTPEAGALATRLLTTEIIPAKAAPDALHLAISAAHGMDFLLTWNCQRPPALPFGQRLRPLAISLRSVANPPSPRGSRAPVRFRPGEADRLLSPPGTGSKGQRPSFGDAFSHGGGIVRAAGGAASEVSVPFNQ